jgi:predicted TIM-barrel fold metal-dependent hydrolase
MIDCFGPERCMLESNFPVDKFSIGYHTLYNAFKKMVGGYSSKAQDQMFSQTAATIYNLVS